MAEERRFTLQLEQLDDYQFNVKFDFPEVNDLVLDEPPPLGRLKGPNASRMVAAAAANCLSASLLYCLTKAEAPAHSLKTDVTCKLVRNENKRLRIGGLDVRLEIAPELEASLHLNRCLDLFENFSVVGESLRKGIPIQVEVVNRAGELIRRSA